MARSSLHLKAGYICADYSHSKENPCQASGGPYILGHGRARDLIDVQEIRKAAEHAPKQALRKTKAISKNRSKGFER